MGAPNKSAPRTSACDASTIKAAAAGRWPEILAAVGNLDSAVLDGKNHPCPRCGGKDRFRLIDTEAGAVLCNQCFKTGNGDGFAAIQWMRGITFSETLHLVATHLGMNGKPSPATTENKVPGKQVAWYGYEDEQGNLLYQVVRYEPKTFKQRRPDGKGGWIWSLKEVRRVPYRLPALVKNPQAPVVICEGEKDCIKVTKLGILATTNAGGAENWSADFAPYFADRDVAILPHNDKNGAGRRHAERVAASLHGNAKSVRIVELPVHDDGGDVTDWIEAGGTKDKLIELIKAAPQWEPSATTANAEAKEVAEANRAVNALAAKKDGSPDSQSKVLVDLARERSELFHDPDRNCYARYEVNEHHEVARINSKNFKQWLARLYYEEAGKPPNAQAMADTVNLLEGLALYDGEERPVFLRLAEVAGRIYLDLCNDQWQAVEIGGTGWRIIDDCPVMFRRAKAMFPLPLPVPGGSIDQLRRFIQVSDDQYKLIVGWLVAALRPGQPFPILALDGEHGSGKSTLARMLRGLIDPNTADVRSGPKDPRDLMIMANNGHVISLDNLSYLPPWLSDCLRCLATGAGFSTRTLYENDEETIFSAKRPIILNGIEQVTSRADLLDRSLLVSLGVIPESRRRTEAEIWAEFNSLRPALLGALLTAVSSAIAKLPTTRLSSLPRMADFALWVTAAEPELGWQPGDFLAAYTGNREDADSLAIEASVIGKFLIELLEAQGGFEGTATELLKDLERRAGFIGDIGEEPRGKRRPKGWPGSAKVMSGQVKRIAPLLRKLGWSVEADRDKGRDRTRRLVIRKDANSCVHSVRSVQPAERATDLADANQPAADAKSSPADAPEATKVDHRTHADAADDVSRDAENVGHLDISAGDLAEDFTRGEL